MLLACFCVFLYVCLSGISCCRLPGQERQLVHPAEDEAWRPLGRAGTAAGGDRTGLLNPTQPDAPHTSHYRLSPSSALQPRQASTVTPETLAAFGLTATFSSTTTRLRGPLLHLGVCLLPSFLIHRLPATSWTARSHKEFPEQRPAWRRLTSVGLQLLPAQTQSHRQHIL